MINECFDDKHFLKTTTMKTEVEDDEICTPLYITETELKTFALMPQKSRKVYGIAYTAFMDWRSQNNINSFSENVLLDYFTNLSEKYKPSSLSKLFSILKSTLSLNNDINIESYTKLRAFMKRNSKGYHAKTAKSFTPDEVHKFINKAPDDIYLATKVALIMGIMGACHTIEMYSMNIEDVEDLGTAMLVSIPNNQTKTVRKFTITGHFYEICKKYTNLRPPKLEISSFFLNYVNGKCTGHNIGINKLGSMGKKIATFLKLPNPEMYTGHSFRRSSSSKVLKGYSSWKRTSVTDEFMTNKIHHSKKHSINMSTQQSAGNTINESFDINSIPSLTLINCSNITFNFVTKSN